MKVSKKLILALSCCCVLTLSMTGCSLFKCKHENTIVENQVAASCANPGYTGDTKCAECGELIQAGMSIAAPDHQTSVVDAKEATCKEEGYTGDAICDVCGITVIPGEPIAVLQHDGEKIDAKEPTCQEAGFSGDTKCKLCGEVYEKGIVLDVVDHDWVEKEVITQATCKQEGKRIVECRFCQTTMEEKVAKLEHQIVTDPSVEATCTTAGKTEGKRCAVCKTVIQEQSVIKALGHDVVTTSQGTDPTCTKDGKASVSRCQRCNQQLTNGEVIKASGHKETKTDAVAATCTTPGKTEGSTCSVCKTVIKEATSIAATGHKTVANAEVAPTCETDGKKGGQHCSVCNTVTSESTVVPALGHKVKIVDKKEATCAEEGYTGDEVCETCNKTIKEGTPIEKIAHEIRDVGNAVPATCTEEGRTSDKICTKCETVVEAGTAIPVLEHNYVEQEGTAKEATCTEFGHENNRICTLCQDVQQGDRIAKKPHTRVEAPETAIEATCQERGKRADVVCADCGKTISKGRTTNKVLCSAIEGNDAVESTCSVAGHGNSQICKWCEKIMVEGEPLPLLPHETAERGAVAATCTEKGKTAEVYCTVCGAVTVESEPIDVIPHTPVKTGEDVEATCTTEGIVYGTKCGVCDKALTDDTILEIVPHDFTNKDKDVNIVIETENYATAVVTMQCDGCLEQKDFEGIVTDKNITKAPTCTEEGTMTCTVKVAITDDVEHVYTDLDYYMDIIPHAEAVTEGKAPTCTEDGYTDEITCPDCGTVIKEKEIIPARHVNFIYNSHKWDDEYPELNKDDGCVVTLYLTCTDCEEDFEARASIFETIEEVPATCVEDGFAKYNMLIKSDEFSENYIELTRQFAAKKHIVSQFPSYTSGNLPSYNLSANEVYCDLTCDECGETFKHLYNGKLYFDPEPTCEERGLLIVEWAVDNTAIRIAGVTSGGSGYREIAANGHAYEDEEHPDVCSVCGTHKALKNDNWWMSETAFPSHLTTLTIQKEIPEEGTYQESWIVDRDNMGYLKAYLVDDETLIISTMGADKLYLGTTGYFVAYFNELTTINGMDLVDISNCEYLQETFVGCSRLTTLDIKHWVTDKEKIELRDTFKQCLELTTILSNKEFVNKIMPPSELTVGESDNTFLGCVKLVGTQLTEDGETVSAYDANNIGALAARIYFTYSLIEEVEEAPVPTPET